MRADKVVYVVAGSQGEQRSALARVARDDHPFIELGEGDLVCFSARAIPGNERKINEVINNLVARRVQVLTANDAPIHTSGHAYADDIAEMLSWTKPQIVVAVHGETMQQKAHVDLARASGVKNAIAPVNGELWSLSDEKPERVTVIEAGLQYIEGARILDPDHGALAERRKVSFNGAVFVTLSGRDVTVTTLGLIDDDDEDDRATMQDLVAQLRELIRKGDGKGHGHHNLPEAVRTYTRRFFDLELGFKPMVVVHVS